MSKQSTHPERYAMFPFRRPTTAADEDDRIRRSNSTGMLIALAHTGREQTERDTRLARAIGEAVAAALNPPIQALELKGDALRAFREERVQRRQARADAVDHHADEVVGDGHAVVADGLVDDGLQAGDAPSDVVMQGGDLVTGHGRDGTTGQTAAPRVDRELRIANVITGMWPHRMSRRAAQAVRARFLRDMADEVREVNEANGWHDTDRSFGDGIALLHSEVSEALEAFRDHGLADATVAGRDQSGPSKPEGVGSEFADVLIRLLDECDRQGIDLEQEFTRKLAFNRTRGHRHGGKAL